MEEGHLAMLVWEVWCGSARGDGEVLAGCWQVAREVPESCWIGA